MKKVKSKLDALMATKEISKTFVMEKYGLPVLLYKMHGHVEAAKVIAGINLSESPLQEWYIDRYDAKIEQ